MYRFKEYIRIGNRPCNTARRCPDTYHYVTRNKAHPGQPGALAGSPAASLPSSPPPPTAKALAGCMERAHYRHHEPESSSADGPAGGGGLAGAAALAISAGRPGGHSAVCRPRRVAVGIAADFLNGPAGINLAGSISLSENQPWPWKLLRSIAENASVFLRIIFKHGDGVFFLKKSPKSRAAAAFAPLCTASPHSENCAASGTSFLASKASSLSLPDRWAQAFLLLRRSRKQV